MQLFKTVTVPIFSLKRDEERQAKITRSKPVSAQSRYNDDPNGIAIEGCYFLNRRVQDTFKAMVLNWCALKGPEVCCKNFNHNFIKISVFPCMLRPRSFFVIYGWIVLKRTIFLV